MQNLPTAITGEETISDILFLLPEAGDILMSHGLHCVNCSLNMYEPLNKGARMHGFSEEEIEEVILDLNDAVKDIQETHGSTEIRVTNSARDEIWKIQVEQDMFSWGLYIEPQTTPEGTQYYLDLREPDTQNYKTVKRNGIKVFFDPEKLLTEGIVIDIDQDEGCFVVSPI